LAPLAHLALALMAEGKVHYRGEILPAKEVMKRLEITPLSPQEKEGLSLINGTCFMAAVAASNVVKAKRLLKSADLIAAFSLVSFSGLNEAFAPEIHQARLLDGQRVSAANIRSVLLGYQGVATKEKVQDPYSFRCVPQVHGATRDALGFVEGIVDKELNGVTDNPLVIAEDKIMSGGNFHGQALAMSMDFLAIAASEIASISERRIEKLTNPNTNRGLPGFLVEKSGVNSGFMIPHVVAASLVCENKIYSHPASVDSIPTSADQEDHVSMGATSAMKAEKVLKNVATVLAIELLASSQACELRKLDPVPKYIDKMLSWVRSNSAFMRKDKSLSEDIESLSVKILNSEFLSVISSEANLQ
jgi:histidine ammonia-lyase